MTVWQPPTPDPRVDPALPPLPASRLWLGPALVAAAVLAVLATFTVFMRVPLSELPLASGDPMARMSDTDDVYALDLATWKIRRAESVRPQPPGAAD